MRGDLVLRVIAKLLIPFMLLFALYVQFHGELGPGGGFQAGVIIAAAIVFYAIIFGLPAARRLLPDTIVESMVAGGVLDLRRSRGRRAPARRKLPRLLRARSRSGPRAGARDLLGRGWRGDHRLRRDAQDLLHVRRARARPGRSMSLASHYGYWITIFLMIAGLFIVIARGNLVKKLIGLGHLPDLGLSAVHRTGQADRGHRADPRPIGSSLLQPAAARAYPHCDRRGGRDARARSRDRGAHP